MTTAAVVAYYRDTNEAKVSYAGHPPVLSWRSGDKSWSYAKPAGLKDQIDSFPANLPLAIDFETSYGQLTISISPGDRLLVYSDGIIDAPSPKGESFGLARLKDVLDANAEATLSGLKFAILDALHEYTQKELNHDDITLIALEIS